MIGSEGDPTDARIEDLKQFLSERPQNAKATSQLACLLLKQAQALERSGHPAEYLRAEALVLAHRATKLAPTKAFGYAALSAISLDCATRKKYLQEAIDRCGLDRHVFARAGLLVRLLLEPREHQANLLREETVAKARIGRSSPQHPSRRDLDRMEEELYSSICQTLEAAWSRPQKPRDNFPLEALAQYEIKLGLFFRKRDPPERHRPRSIGHFTKVCRMLPDSHPTHTMAQFWLATLQKVNCGALAISRCPPDYIVGLYGTFAPRFDSLLVESLQYQTPRDLRSLVDRVLSATTRIHKAVDLGCGTGLSGQAFCNLVQGPFLGVDLSPHMIAQARQRNIYHELVVGECTCALDGLSDLDLIVACDVFCYMGDLQEVFSAAHSSLSSTGIFAFSTELWQPPNGLGIQDYVLQACARFAHSKRYIVRLAMEHSFTLVGCTESVIRKNQGNDVWGLLVALRKTNAAG